MTPPTVHADAPQARGRRAALRTAWIVAAVALLVYAAFLATGLPR